jgi:hypothetical protein
MGRDEEKVRARGGNVPDVVKSERLESCNRN